MAINPSAVGKFALILPVSRAVILVVDPPKKKKKKKVFRMSMWKGGKPPSFPTISISFHSVDSVRKWCCQGKTWETTKYKLSKAIIQNRFYGTYAEPAIWGALVSTVYTLYHPLRRG